MYLTAFQSQHYDCRSRGAKQHAINQYYYAPIFTLSSVCNRTKLSAFYIRPHIGTYVEHYSSRPLLYAVSVPDCLSPTPRVVELSTFGNFLSPGRLASKV